MNVQVFGTKSSSDTRKALRFFKERRIPVHFVDLKTKAASKRELERFARLHGVEALVDRSSKRFRDLGLAVAHRSEAGWLEILRDEPLVLRMPLVRWGNEVTVGADESAWKAWAAEARQ